MSRLPASPDLDHLRKQAKRLLRAFRSGDEEAVARFRTSLPAAQSRPAAQADDLGEPAPGDHAGCARA